MKQTARPPPAPPPPHDLPPPPPPHPSASLLAPLKEPAFSEIWIGNDSLSAGNRWKELNLWF